tara:strand:+ start:5182 stop:5415 length:234 start_codon:yes stop_codon:yes gene_type:complete
MNSSVIEPTNGVPVEWEYTAIAALALFVVSEVMPFLKKTKGMGLIHSAICLLRGSKCMVDKVLEVAEKAVEEDNSKV